jgi:type IV pilus assembly protein PilB
MTVTPEIRQLTLERRTSDEIKELAIRQGMRCLRDDGLDKVREGRTSIAEIARVIGSS